MPRFTIQTLMIVTGVVATIIATVTSVGRMHFVAAAFAMAIYTGLVTYWSRSNPPRGE